MLLDTHAIQCNNILSAEIAALTEKWEIENGPVETLPIRTDDKRIPYRITCPEKKQQRLSDEAVKVRSRSKINEERKQIRAANRERVKALANCTLSAKAIAERTGLSISTVRSILKEAA